MVFRDYLFDAYLDIETTGLSLDSEIMVVGLYLTNGNQYKIVQLAGRDINKENLIKALNGVGIIFTYNGSRFDLPFIHASLGINLEPLFNHHDLMYDCWEFNLFGGFKAVEKQLGIDRFLQNATGRNIIRSWQQYRQEDDQEALTLLLGYNKEDVMNLKVLREKLWDLC
jgi:uncharacterized protein